MTKPLELTIYPHSKKHFNSNWLSFYITPGGLMAAGQGGVIPASKRLSESELAAEWHANEVESWRMVSRRPEFYNIDVAEKLEARESTLRRFATNPHYFEATEPESDTE